MISVNGYPLYFFMLLLGGIYWNPAMAQESRPLRRPQFQARANKTAIWVGDELEYEVTIHYEGDIELVTDHLKEDTLNLEPFKILHIRTDTKKLFGTKKVTKITFILTCYEIGKSELTIPLLSIYYSRPGSGLQGGKSLAEDFTVPAMKIGWGSTLTGDSRNIREFKPMAGLSRVDRFIPPPGILGILFLTALLARWAVVRIRTGLPKGKRMDGRFWERAVMSPLEEIRRASGQTPEEWRQRYTQLSQILGEFIRHWTGTEMAGLTPEEIKTEIVRQGKDGEQAERIGEILEKCQFIRYAPEGHLTGKETIDQLLEETREVILEAINSHGGTSLQRSGF